MFFECTPKTKIFIAR